MAFSLTHPSRLALVGLFLVVSLVLYRPFAFASKQAPMSTTSSDLAGWRTRATGLDSAAAFVPTREALVFAVQHSTPVNPEGFTVALFTPDVAVAADGAVLRLAPADFAGLAALAKSTLDLPQPFQWRVKSATTDKPIDNVVIDGKVAYGVYNWNTQSRTLKDPVEGRTELPEEIQTLLALAKEAVGPNGWPRTVPDIGKRVNALVADE